MDPGSWRVSDTAQLQLQIANYDTPDMGWKGDGYWMEH
jgi:hypothetical protein